MLGELLKDLRSIYHVPPEILADGLCTISMLRKYETGERQPDKLLGDSLWQRMGRSMDKFDANLDHDEYTLAEKRAYMQELIRQGQLEEAEKVLLDYEKLAKIDKRRLHHQFACLQWAELFRRRKAEIKQQEKVILEGLLQTIPEFTASPKIMAGRRFSVMELLLLERYALLFESKTPEIAFEWYQAIQTYLEQTSDYGINYDLADKYKLLPPVLYRMAIYFFKAGLHQRALQYLEKGCNMLGMLQSLSALFVQMKELQFQIMTEAKQQIPMWEQECLNLIKEAIGEHRSEWMENTFPDYMELSLHSVNSTLRERRLAHGLSPEELAAEICDVRTLKTAENGQRMLQSAKKKALFQELKLSTRKFDGTLITRRYSDFQDSAEMKMQDYTGDIEKTEKLYKKLACGLKKDEVTNHQFICYWDIRLRYSKKELTRKEYQNELWKLLRETLPDTKEHENSCILTKYEVEIINDLAWTARDTDLEQAEKLLEAQYRRFMKEKVLLRFFPWQYTSTAYCLGRITRRKKNFTLAEYYLDTALNQIYYLQNDGAWASLFIQHFYLEEEKQMAQDDSPVPKEKDKINFQWIRYAYAIEKLYHKDTIKTAYIEDYIDKYYENKNAILHNLME